MISVIIYELGAIELQRTLVSSSNGISEVIDPDAPDASQDLFSEDDDHHEALDDHPDDIDLDQPFTMKVLGEYKDGDIVKLDDDDLEQLDAGMLLYDAFYRWARDTTDEGHERPAASTRS